MKIVLLVAGISLGLLVIAGLVMLIKDMHYYRRMERNASKSKM